MDTLQALILGLVQGVTEFLPISSSAHLIFIPNLTGWADQGLLFDISVHVGTLAAVMVYFYKDVIKIIYGKLDIVKGNFESENAKLVLMLIISTTPLVLIAPFIKEIVEVYLRNIVVIGSTSIGFGLFLWWADRLTRSNPIKGKAEEISKLTYKNAIIFGLFQAVAMIPGTSRSGICMTAGRLLGFSREAASHYAMLMAMPVILLIGAASLINDFSVGVNLTDNLNEILIGAIASFTSALLAIHLLMKFVEKIGFMPFVIYRVALGVVLYYVAFN